MNHREEFVALARSRGWESGAVLGLGSGSLLELLLVDVAAVRVVGVDHFVRSDRKLRVLSLASRHPARCVVLIMKTAEAAKFIADGSLDFVHIDAGRKYGCVRSDLRAWLPKLRAGGWIGGPGYCDAYPGVIKAVDERFAGRLTVSGTTLWGAENVDG